MNDKISVITVVYNDVSHIRETIESFFSLTWPDKEYIVIDGGSTDGTADIIREYANRLAYWCSEKDNGIYDAMNKGIAQASGDWINFLNSGDYYVAADAIEQALTGIGEDKTVGVIYGNSIEINEGDDQGIEATNDPGTLSVKPGFRHGSSIVRTAIQKKYTFDLTKAKSLGYSLDWEMIHRMYRAGVTFKKVNTYIQAYHREGTSNNALRSLWYNYKITSEGNFKPTKLLFFVKTASAHFVTHTSLYRWMKGFFVEFGVNDVLPHIPFWAPRRMYLKMLRMRIGQKSFIMKDNYITKPNNVSIGDYTHVNRGCLLDARGGITIGNSVSISHQVRLLTGSHDPASATFRATYLPIKIEDYAWLGAGCTILNNVTIGEGAVVCAGAVVTKDVPPYTIVGGIPAKKIKDRPRGLHYRCIWEAPFT